VSVSKWNLSSCAQWIRRERDYWEWCIWQTCTSSSHWLRLHSYIDSRVLWNACRTSFRVLRKCIKMFNAKRLNWCHAFPNSLRSAAYRQLTPANFWKFVIYSVTQEFSKTLYNQKVHFLSQMNPVHATLAYFSNIDFNIIHLPTSSQLKNVVFWNIKTLIVLHRRHITSPLQSSAG
jgi:hypothetical protein